MNLKEQDNDSSQSETSDYQSDSKRSDTTQASGKTAGSSKSPTEPESF